MIVGSVIFARSQRHLWRMLSAGTAAVGLAYLGFTAAPSLPYACAAAVVGGVGNGVQWASLLGTVQSITAERFLGRTLGALEAIGSASPTLGLFAGGAIAGLANPRVAFAAMGIGACVTTAAFVAIGRMPDQPSQQPEATAGTVQPEAAVGAREPEPTETAPQPRGAAGAQEPGPTRGAQQAVEVQHRQAPVAAELTAPGVQEPIK
jgi:MFS family permease